MYEYKFVRLGDGGLFGVKQAAEEEYQQVIRDHAAKGWRLIQIFAPPIGNFGRAVFYELVFEKESET
ncbi:MAG TPA: DUF4177 domain-containing protein [Thermoanaerobaculia bacterium]|jgi:hypothetical protein|nr:DUF4177 domain-containing protein [Thermoanaerobaculia bacterium]